MYTSIIDFSQSCPSACLFVLLVHMSNYLSYVTLVCLPPLMNTDYERLVVFQNGPRSGMYTSIKVSLISVSHIHLSVDVSLRIMCLSSFIGPVFWENHSHYLSGMYDCLSGPTNEYLNILTTTN